MTPAQIGDLTLDEVERLFDYWRIYPPVRDLVAAFVGFRPDETPAEDKPQYMSADDMRRLMGTTGGKLPGMAPR